MYVINRGLCQSTHQEGSVERRGHSAQRAVAWTGAVSEVKVSCRGRRAAAQGGGRGAAIY